MEWWAELEAREKSYTARIDLTDLSLATGDLPEPWRCFFCNLFVYRRNGMGYPMPGAPTPFRTHDPFTDDHVLTCELCHFLINNPKLRTEYWQAIHDGWVEREKRRFENNLRLNGDKDYFTGA